MDNLIATKALMYNTRRLMAGDAFQAKPADAKLLIAIKKARRPEEGAEAFSPRAAPVSDDASALRAEYERKFGKKPYMGWDADMLQSKLARA
ncbi:MAG TPA: hypothetical protein VLZ84_06745 [Asticcacaulis sp.]|nr:hypothetical protein [Asticcacaulis sp.]